MSPRDRAQAIINGVSNKNNHMDNVEELLGCIERATQAPPSDIADLFSSFLGACVPWDRYSTLGFKCCNNLILWRNVDVGDGQMMTISHAFSAVSMKRWPYLFNSALNHSADIADGVIKGVMALCNGKRFSMRYGYGAPNRLGDVMGGYMAVRLSHGTATTLFSAFQQARRQMFNRTKLPLSGPPAWT